MRPDYKLSGNFRINGLDGISEHVALSKRTVRMMTVLGESAFYRTFEPVKHTACEVL